MFERIEYQPLIRMLAIAVWHPVSTSIWEEESLEASEHNLTSCLHSIAACKEDEKNPDATKACENPYRKALLAALSGELGPWRVSGVANLTKAMLIVLDDQTLAILEVLPDLKIQYSPSVLEQSIATFLAEEHSRASQVSFMTIQFVSSLAITLLLKLGTRYRPFEQGIESSIVWRSLQDVRYYFYRKIFECRSLFGIADLFVDLVAAAVATTYRKRSNMNLEGLNQARYYFAYSIPDQYATLSASEILVRKVKGVITNDVESTRFNIQNAIHFRALHQCMEKYRGQLETFWKSHMATDKTVRPPQLVLLDPAGELSTVFTALRGKPLISSDINLRGRTTFRFNLGEEARALLKAQNNEDSELVLVLDGSDILVVRPLTPSEVVRGKVLICIPALHVIGVAEDGAWLHMAIRHSDFDFLIKNGNMSLGFDSPGTCAIVSQYLDRNRKILRRDLLVKIEALFEVDDDQLSIPHPETI